MEHSRRTVITAGAWAMPVIAMAVAVPAAAASGAPALTLDPTFQFQADQYSYYLFVVTNPGATTIPAGQLQVIADFGPFYTFLGGSNSDSSWTSQLPGGSGGTRTFASTVPLDPGARTTQLQMIIGNGNPTESVNVTITAMATGYTSATTVLAIAPAPQ